MNTVTDTSSTESAVVATSESKPTRRVVIAATFTAEPLADSLTFWLSELNLPFQLEFAPFNQIFQQLLDRASVLSKNERGLNVILLRLEDLGAFGSSSETAELRRIVNQLVSSVLSSQAIVASPTLVCICPPSDASVEFAESAANYESLKTLLEESLKNVNGVRLLHHQDVAERYLTGMRTATQGQTHGHIPYTRAYFAALGTAVIRFLHSLEKSPAKVLVLDCDQTLWRGVSAEDGVGGVAVDASHRAIQEFALSQRAAGILVCLCSKNSEEDVFSVLDEHPDMLLRREHITAARINWDPKSANLRAMARQLNLGLDSFVLLDDSAVECAEVRAHAPEVLALKLPEDPAQIGPFLNRIWAFDGSAGTKEDAKRAEFYRQDSMRENLRKQSFSFSDFIAGLGLEIRLFTPEPVHMARFAQLTQRTNQFNNTTIRRKEQEIRQLVGSPDSECIAVEVRDRFGDYGLVGVVICSAGDDCLMVDSLLMSCRALGRGVEHRLLAYVGERAIARKLSQVEVPYVQTSKNQPALKFLRSLGAETAAGPEASIIFRMTSKHAAEIAFTPYDNSDTMTEAEEADSTSAPGMVDARPRRVASEIWQDVAETLSSIDCLLSRIDSKRVRPRPAMGVEFALPRTDFERRLAELWARTLGLDRVGIHDDFFELGGTSLQATVLANTLQQELQRQFHGVIIFEAPTIATLSDYLGTPARDRGPASQLVLATSSHLALSKPGPADLSFSQQRLWFLDQVEPSGAAYVIAEAIELHGVLDSRLLERALAALVRRHDSLRTVFVNIEGRPLQVVPDLEADTWTLPLADLSGEPDGHRRLAQLLRVESSRGFDLAMGPLFRARLYRIAADTHVLLLAMHHIVSDGWSLSIVMRELVELYGRLARGETATLPALPIRYSDFARWQRSWLRGEALEGLLAHWRTRLAGAPQILELPTDRARPPVESHRGATYSFTLPLGIAEGLRELGQREGATLFMTLLSGFSLLLSRYSGQQDLLVGTAVANRNQTAIENVVGLFINTLVLRVNLSGDVSARELLARMRGVCLDAFAHQDLPFDRLVEDLRPPRDLSRNPLFQVMFILQNASLGTLELPGLTLKPVEVDRGAAQVDLRLDMQETAAGLRGIFEYATDLFDETTIARMAASLRLLLEAMVTAPERRVRDLPLLPEAERDQLLHEWNATAAAFPERALVHELFEAQVGRAPERTAVKAGAMVLSYAELEARANRLAQALRARGVGRGARVGLCVERGAQMLAAVLGILKAGAAYVPLDPSFPQERLRFMAEDAQLALLVSTSALVEPFGLPRERQLLLDADAKTIDSTPTTRLPVDVHSAQPEDPAYVIYTSGSTGKPKGVVVPHRAVVNFLTSMAREPGLTADDVLVAVTTLSFDIAVLELQLPLTVGATVVIASRDEAMDGRALKGLLEEHRATVMQATPVTWRLLLEAGWKAPKGFKALVGGEALPKDLADQLIACGVALWNMYGPTETTVWSTCAHITDTANGITIGKPIANTTVYVLDAHRNLCPIGVPGELCIGGAGVTLGYWGRPELTAERFIADPFSAAPGARLYRTGDRARWRAEGTLEHLGRLDFQVKLRGFRVELGEIEAVLAEHPDVREVVVITREDVPGDQRLAAYLVAESPPADLVEQLRALLRANLPEYMVPSHFVRLDSLPLTPNGKLNRKALPAPAVSLATDGRTYDAPRTPAENAIAQIWSAVLGTERVGVNDNFFDLGGHSLLLLQAHSRMRALQWPDVPFVALMQYPTVRMLASYLSGTAEQSVVPAAAADRARKQHEAMLRQRTIRGQR